MGIETQGLSMEEQGELWRFAGPATTGIVGPMGEAGLLDWPYTLAEGEMGIENVRTGLRRKLERKPRGVDDEMESDEGDDDEEEGQVMEDVMPSAEMPKDVLGEVKGLELGRTALPVEVVMRFMCVGTVPQR